MPPPTTAIRINGERLWSSLMTLADIGGTARGGCNRQALTDTDKAGRDLFTSWTRALGCTVTVDEVGNLFASRAGEDASAAPVLMGSHLDTQATGGRFDGVYGVLSGLEVLRTLGDHRIATRRAVEVASWTNEEGCRFAPAMLGSGVRSSERTRWPMPTSVKTKPGALFSKSSSGSAIAVPRRRGRDLPMQCLKRTSNRVPSWRRPARQSAW